ncbi:unnamed protein product, partial [Prorocentrum cordatum]
VIHGLHGYTTEDHGLSDLAVDEDVMPGGSRDAAVQRRGVSAAGRSVREIAITSCEPLNPERLSPRPHADTEREEGNNTQVPAFRCTLEVNSERGLAQSPDVLLEQ